MNSCWICTRYASWELLGYDTGRLEGTIASPVSLSARTELNLKNVYIQLLHMLSFHTFPQVLVGMPVRQTKLIKERKVLISSEDRK